MIEFSLDLESGPLKQILEKAPSELQRIVSDEIADWALRTSNLAKSRSPVRTGNLRQSIIPERTEGSASVSATVMYAKYVEPPPLGVPMKRRMTRTQFLYSSAMEELQRAAERMGRRINSYFEV